MKKKYELFFGKHTSLAILNSKHRNIDEILISKEKEKEYLSLISKDKFNNLITKTTNRELDRLCKIEDKHQGIAVKCSEYIFNYTLEDLIKEAEDKDNFCILAMDELNDPQNFGSIIRSAYAFEIDAIIITKRNSCSITNSVVRASVGYSELIKIIEVQNLGICLDKLKKQSFWIFGLDSHASDLKIENLFKEYSKTVFILGSEGFGMRDSIKKNTDINVKIEINKDVESLNVSNTSTIISYEYFNFKKKIKNN